MSKSSSTSSSSSATTPSPSIKPESYSHSPVHYAVVLGDHTTLTRLLSTLPKLTDPTQIHTESDSLNQEKLADKISSLVDRRDVPYRETPLHLAVRLNDLFAAKSLAAAAADVSLQNSAGWNPLQEALCRRYSEIALILLRLHHRSAWSKWRRRLPRLTAVLRRMRDFYMEISFHFESSVIPFVNKLAPSDTYKIWKRDANLRADTTLAGFDGLKIQRADQSFLFLGDGDQAHSIPPGSLLVLNHDERKIFDAFESAGAPMSESDIAGFCSQTSVYRPGMDVTKAELISRTNWRRQEKTESVGEWKAKVYELNNVVFSFRSRKVIESDVAGSEQVLPLEFDEDDDGFLVAENPSFLNFEFNNGNESKRRHSSFVREEREFVSVGRKSVDIYPSSTVTERRRVVTVPEKVKEKEYVKSLKPSVWLTEQFPLKIEELLPLLDILANKVKAVRRMRELLTTKFPAGTFPVKKQGTGVRPRGWRFPVVPTVRVVITFTKFVELPAVEQFYTPLSSPRLFGGHGGGRVGSSDESDTHYTSLPSSSSSSSSSSKSTTWLQRNSSQSASKQHRHSSSVRGQGQQQQLQSEPFAIPSGYTWTSVDEKSTKLKKCKSTRKSK
ncbi:ANKYRIN REPEAT FAMILY PROTEIN [Salix purpurea]|uniref:ANKYRIN REPEAT FAMILY PROTEIN n=1 Tax=Salix purpurea TaxID=77065 RepID=A0A9Q0WNB3_SALPP|nr:ANKYRIN REPEAT FAMILY PROTEIN [Salix purpurea]